MVGFFQSFLNTRSSRLSQRIVSWVFFSILIIEFVILIPSYGSRRKELLGQLEETSTQVLVAVKGNLMMDMGQEELLDDLPDILHRDTKIVGVALYDVDGNLVDSYGEMPFLGPILEEGQDKIGRLYHSGNRYDIAWSREISYIDYSLVVRHNSESVRRALWFYLVRLLLLILLIAVFVTIVTLWGLERILIIPVLHLRDDLRLAGDVVHQNYIPQLYSFSHVRSDELGEVTQAFRNMFQRIYSEIHRRKLVEAALTQEKAKSDRLLKNMLPESIAQQLKQEDKAIANRIEEATILFADIADFTGLAAQVTPIELVEMLNQIFSAFDQLAEKHKLEKIKTIGDAYMVVGGATCPLENSAQAVVEMALDMQEEIKRFKRKNGEMFQLRIGINTGTVVAGVIGLKKYSYDLWGDAVNIASRMESHGEIGRIHLSESTYQRLKGFYYVEPRGCIDVKGRGMMSTYFLLGRKLLSSGEAMDVGEGAIAPKNSYCD
ncbi:MAG: adenylate/guanylate cyclase domain-containing protein [Cyanobacteria bacterium P01_F01_bin.150]